MAAAAASSQQLEGVQSVTSERPCQRVILLANSSVAMFGRHWLFGGRWGRGFPRFLAGGGAEQPLVAITRKPHGREGWIEFNMADANAVCEPLYIDITR